LTAEDKIHWGVLLVLLGLTGLTFREGTPDPAATPGARELPPDWRAAASGVTRGELDQAIAQLSSAVDSWKELGPTAAARNLRLQALGRPGLDQGQPEADVLAALFASQGAPALAAPADTRPAAASDRQSPPVSMPPGRLDMLATLTSLLEAGVPLERSVTLPAGAFTLKQLVATALEREEQPLQPRAEPSPWELDLLALATVRGEKQYRERLAQGVQTSLTRLDRRQRTFEVRQGTGALSSADLARLAQSWQEPAERALRVAELHLAAAVFRAVAVLVEPELERQARRYLNGLLFRYQTDRVLYDHLLSTASAPGLTITVRLDALESLGRLEQALYGAHLSFRRPDAPAPAPQVAQMMREAAHDLREHVEQLERAGALRANPTELPEASLARLRAVVHALRGLRAARVAT
jgi:hypothetical protein